MHCIRWWLPLFLLPLPAIGPVFLVLFVIVYAIQTKPCAYCSVMLALLVASSCAFYPASKPTPELTPAQQTCFWPTPNRYLLGPPRYCAAPAPRQPSSCWLDPSALSRPWKDHLRLSHTVSARPAGISASAGVGRKWLAQMAKKRTVWVGVGPRERRLGYDLSFGWVKDAAVKSTP